MKKVKQFAKDSATDLDAICAPEKHRWRAIRLVEIVLLAIGFVLGGMFVAARFESRITSLAALKAFDATAPSAVPFDLTGSSAMDLPEPDFTNWDSARVRQYQRASEAAKSAAIAVLEIEKIHLIAPVFEGTDALTLNHAIGRIAGTAGPGEQGNIGLAGHRDGFFRGLKEIKRGDAIELRTREGRDIYAVDHLQIVSPRDVSVLQPQPGPSLTLVTCYPFYYLGSAPKRFVVTAYLTQHLPAGPTTSESRLKPATSNSTKEEQ